MAKELKTSVTLETKTAEAKLKALVKAINNVDNAINKANKSSSGLANGLQKSISATTRLQSAQKAVTNEVKKTNSEHKKTKSLLDGIGSKLKQLASAYLGIMGMSAIIGASDTITKSENKLNQINNGDKAATKAQMDAMYAAAQRSRTGYGDMMANVSKSMTLAPDAFGGDMNAAIAFQEIMGKSYSLGGASAAEQSSSMYQMIQALGSGKLAGDELRSVTEGAPLAAKQIEKFAQEVYKTDMALKDMGSKGMITSELVVAAMLSAGDEIEAKFQKTAMTFDQAWQRIKNTALKAFEPVLQKMNQLLNSDAGKAFFSGIETAIRVLATIVGVIWDAFAALFTFLVENWYWIKWIVIGVLAAVIVYLAMMAWQAIVTGVTAFISFLMALSPIYFIILAIAAVIAILAILGLDFAKVCGGIMGAIFVTGVFFKNVWFSMVNVAKGVGAALTVIFQNIGTAFNNVWLECKARFWDFVASVCEGVLKVANLVNKVLGIFGIQIDTGSLESAVYTAKNNAETNRSKKLEYGDVAAAYAEASSTHDTWQDGWASTAFSNGYNIGSEWGQGVTDKISGIGDKLKGAELPSGGGGYDYGELLDNIAGSGGKTAKNTGKMADSMELAAEDLELLYNLAEMEWKKEFTTANITVDMSNYNTINGTGDLDGIVTYLRDGLIEEMSAVANGAYSFG